LVGDDAVGPLPLEYDDASPVDRRLLAVTRANDFEPAPTDFAQKLRTCFTAFQPKDVALENLEGLATFNAEASLAEIDDLALDGAFQADPIDLAARVAAGSVIAIGQSRLDCDRSELRHRRSPSAGVSLALCL
jgi:hypothetical protein